MMDRISICEALAKRDKIKPFLKRIVIGGDKCVTYDNIGKTLQISMSTTGPMEASDGPEAARIGQQKRCVPLGQRQTTHVCIDSPEALAAWLGNFNAPTV
ncbi:hypothetical protein TNCV_1476631 [Trichonephila clavipes]|nr:hypothetical protein TNCV_1476631 [Trichonephila clavipes]